MCTFITFIDEYLGHLATAVVTYSSHEVPSLLKQCRTNCICYQEGKEGAWLRQLLMWCTCEQSKSGCNHVYDLFNDHCMLATCMHACKLVQYNFSHAGSFTEVAAKQKVNVTVLQHNGELRDRFISNLQKEQQSQGNYIRMQTFALSWYVIYCCFRRYCWCW